MRFKKAIIIPVLVYSDDELVKLKLDIDVDINAEGSETEEQAFWEISSAYKGENNTTFFESGGKNYITPIAFELFVEKINSISN